MYLRLTTSIIRQKSAAEKIYRNTVASKLPRVACAVQRILPPLALRQVTGTLGAVRIHCDHSRLAVVLVHDEHLGCVYGYKTTIVAGSEAILNKARATERC
ncbi:MAG: hypothetical protein ACI8W7_000093 [Gammaproteobacteria bacterium]